MNPEPLKTLTALMRHLGIQVLLFDETYEQIEQIDYGFIPMITGTRLLSFFSADAVFP